MTTAGAIVDELRDGDQILIDSSRPRTVASILSRRSALRDVTVYAYGMPYRDPAPIDELAGTQGVSVNVSMVGPGLRDFVAEGTVAVVPRTVHAAARTPKISDARRTVAIVQAPSPDGDTQPLGPLSLYGEQLAAVADVMIVEINPRLPDVGGRSIPTDVVDHSLAVEATLPVLPDRAPTDVHEAIADTVIDVMPQNPTIQLGVGRVGAAIAERVADLEPIDIWSGLLSDGIRPVVESGAATSVVGCIAAGTTESFYDWLADLDGDLDLRSSRVVHSPTRLRALSRFVAINSALEVDTTGQVNAEAVGGAVVSGPGGQPEFMLAAGSQPDGRAIVAMPSTAGDGSRIRSHLSGPVTTPRYAVDDVVTENGHAVLSRRPLDARREVLRRVAEPSHRADLE